MPKTKRPNSTKRSTQKSVKQEYDLKSFEQTLSVYFEKKAPSLPKGVKEILVALAPWLVLLSVVMLMPAFFALLGFSFTGMVAQYTFGWRGGSWMIFSGVFSIVLVVLHTLAIPGLFNKKKSGWNYMFYAVLVASLRHIVMFDFSGLIIGTLLSLYVLFQLRSYYK